MTDKLTVADVVMGLLDQLEADWHGLCEATTPAARDLAIRRIEAEIASHLEMLRGIPEVAEALREVGDDEASHDD